jgi:hypothetical protein
MRLLNKQFAFLFAALILASCRHPRQEASRGGDAESYVVTYTIEYVNNTNADIAVMDGAFVFPTSNDPFAPSSNAYRLTLEKNSAGSFSIHWPYTWYWFVRKECIEYSDRGDGISSFYLQMEINGLYYMIAGWPETVYRRDDIISYGHGYGMDASSIGIIANGELQIYAFNDPTHLSDQTIDAGARLTINSLEDIVFEITGPPRRRYSPLAAGGPFRGPHYRALSAKPNTARPASSFPLP